MLVSCINITYSMSRYTWHMWSWNSKLFPIRKRKKCIIFLIILYIWTINCAVSGANYFSAPNTGDKWIATNNFAIFISICFNDFFFSMCTLRFRYPNSIYIYLLSIIYKARPIFNSFCICKKSVNCYNSIKKPIKSFHRENKFYENSRRSK